VDVEKAIFNLLFVVNHLDHQEHDLRQVKEEMFHMVTWPFLFIFCLFTAKNATWAMLGNRFRCSLLPAISLSDSLDTHFVHFADRKRNLGEVEKTIFQRNDWT
jgi:hypothetical protein